MTVERVVTLQVFVIEELVHYRAEIAAIDDLLNEPADDLLVPFEFIHPGGRRRRGRRRVLVSHKSSFD